MQYFFKLISVSLKKSVLLRPKLNNLWNKKQNKITLND